MPNYNPDSYNAVLARIETKLDDLSMSFKNERDDLDNFKKNIYVRVSKLEHFKFYVLGFAGLASLVITYYLKN